MNDKQAIATASEAVLNRDAEVAETWTVGGNAPVAVTNFGTLNDKPVTFISNNARRGILTADGLWGLGAFTPAAQVHVKPLINTIKALQIDKADGTAAVAVTNDGKTGIGTAFPSARLNVRSEGTETALRVDVPGATALLVDDNGGVSVGSSGQPPAKGLFVSGSTGIGTSNPGIFKVKVIHDNEGGFALENKTLSSRVWEFFVGAGNGPLNLRRDGNVVGQFNVFGQYLVISDERFKTNIQAMPSVLEKIGQLKPSTYRFKDTADKQEYNGFIAQEVMNVFPNLVARTAGTEGNPDTHTLDYAGFGVIAIKGIQELQQIIREQKQTVHALEQRLAKVEAVLAGKGNGKAVQDKGEKETTADF